MKEVKFLFPHSAGDFCCRRLRERQHALSPPLSTFYAEDAQEDVS